MREKLGVISRPAVIAGVPVFIVEPKSMPRAHKDDVILSFHGGGYIEFPGESGTREAVFLAALGGYRVHRGRLSHGARSSLSGGDG